MLDHKWIKNKQHNKLNLQTSISSNWGDSCVSLKNEKAKRHARTKDSTNPYTRSENSAKKSTYGAIYKSHDDKLHSKSEKDSGRKERKPLTSRNSTSVKRKPSRQYRSKVNPVMVEKTGKPTAQDFNGNATTDNTVK